MLCMYHSSLAQLIAIKKGEQYAKTISWIRTTTSFALLRSALVCLRGSRTFLEFFLVIILVRMQLILKIVSSFFIRNELF